MSSNIEKIKKILLGIMMLSTTGLLINSCIDPMYDMAQGINTEIQVGGDSLTLPIGTTDSIRLGDFLSSEDLEFLKTMEDGGYGMTISDSLTIDDLLKDMDVDKLKFDNQTFSQITQVDFGDIDVSDFVIPGFTKSDTVGMNIPVIEIGDVVPTVDIDKDFLVRFSDFALDANSLSLDTIDQQTGKDNLLEGSYPFNAYIGIDNPTDLFFGPFDIPLDDLPPATVNFEIDVPEGVTNIYQVDFEEGGTLEIEIALGDVQQSIEGGKFMPDITVDLTALFDPEHYPLTGSIEFNEELNDSSNSKKPFTSTKTRTISTFYNLPAAAGGKLNLSKDLNVSGSISAQGKVKANKIQLAKEIDLVVNVRLTDLKIKNMDFDIPTFYTKLEGTSTFKIQNNDLPKDIDDVETLFLGQTPNSSLAKNLVINIQTNPDDLPEMQDPSYQIDSLELTFPENFIFSNLSGNTYLVLNTPFFETERGRTIALDLSEIDFSDGRIVNEKSIDWTGDISYKVKLGINGRVNSQDINSTKNPVVNLKSESAIQLESATVMTNLIPKAIESSEIALEYDIDIADQVKRLETINVEADPGCFLRIDITKPMLPLPLKSDEIILQFSDLYEFYDTSNFDQANNAYIIQADEDIPDQIELKLKALNINQNLSNGTLLMKDTFNISGGVKLLPNTVSSTAIEALDDEKLIFKATVTDMSIASTSIEMNTLYADYKDSTVLDMQIEDIPSQIIALDSILLKDGGEIELDITINNMPNLGVNPLKADMTLKFPDLLVFTPGAVNERNELIINEPFVDGKLSKRIGIKSLKFDGLDLNGKLIINDKVKFDVYVSVEDPTVNSDDLQGEDITVDVAVKLKGLDFKSVYGRVDVDFGDQMDIPNIPLDDLPEFMRSKDVVLDILNPILALKTESNVGIPVDTELSLTKYVDGHALTDEKINLNFSLPKANSPDEIMQTGYWFAPKESGMPNDYTFVETNLQNLFKPIPDSVKVEFTPHINTGVQHMIDLVANYNLKVKYDITIPFSFGKDLSILMRDTIENVNLDLGDFNLKTGALEIVAKITNSIPLDLELDLQLMDANDNILATSPSQTVLAGAPDGSGVDSNIKIRLDEGLDNIKDLNKVVLVFKATSNETVAGTPIKPSNFIKASLKARVLGGINITL